MQKVQTISPLIWPHAQGLGGGLGRDAASRRSTPITVGSRADDEDELFPKARGLVRKEARKPGPTAGRRAAGLCACMKHVHQVQDTINMA